MQKNTVACFVLAATLGMPLLGCQDTKARQENVQLKELIVGFQNTNSELQVRIDSLTKENAQLKDENERLKASHSKTKPHKPKHHRTTS